MNSVVKIVKFSSNEKITKIRRNNYRTLFFYDSEQMMPYLAIIHFIDSIDEFDDELQSVITQSENSDHTLIILVNIDYYNNVHESLKKSNVKPIEMHHTEREYQYFKQQIASSANSSNLKVEFFMYDASSIMVKENIKVIMSDVSLHRAWQKMLDNGIGHLPVIEKERDTDYLSVIENTTNRDYRLLGVLSLTDVLIYAPAANADDEIRDHKLDEMSKIAVNEIIQSSVSNLITVKTTDTLDFVAKSLSSSHGGKNISLLPVIEGEMSLKGIISWVEVFRNWHLFDRSKQISLMKATEIGTPYSIVKKYHMNDTIAFIVNVEKDKKSRHIVIEDSGKPVKILFKRELLPFTPLADATEHELSEFYNIRVESITPKHDISELSVSSDTVVWDSDNPKSLIGCFLDSITGKEKPWENRIECILSFDEKGAPKSLITPFDCIKLLV